MRSVEDVPRSDSSSIECWSPLVSDTSTPSSAGSPPASAEGCTPPPSGSSRLGYRHIRFGSKPSWTPSARSSWTTTGFGPPCASAARPSRAALAHQRLPVLIPTLSGALIDDQAALSMRSHFSESMSMRGCGSYSIAVPADRREHYHSDWQARIDGFSPAFTTSWGMPLTRDPGVSRQLPTRVHR